MIHKIKKFFARTLHLLEDSIDSLKHKYIRKYDKTSSVLIHAYRGYGTEARFHIIGRVLEDSGIVKAAKTDSVWRNLRSMYKRFESDEIPGAKVRAEFQGEAKDVSTDEEGYFDIILEPVNPLRTDRIWHEVRLKLVSMSGTDGKAVETEAEVFVPPLRAEYGVISDIDDTVIKTDVSNLAMMLRHTLLSNSITRLPFDGVASFYRALFNGVKGASNNPIFYVSNGPWNLYDMLVDFMELHGIPKGPLFLRDWGVDKKLYVNSSPYSHKLDTINGILETYPNLNFILIGDSGEKDPEIYEQVVTEHPGRVHAIYIRDISQPSRAAAVREIKKNIENKGVDVLLVKDTSEAQNHALSKDFIE
ncbi:MAG: DUF2183 domain-containing protein [Deltaproteobacteria bacterium]